MLYFIRKMFGTKLKISFYYVLLTLVWPIAANVNDPQIFIDLSNVSPGRTITRFLNITSPEYTTISVINLNSNINFFVLQVHTFSENITLSYEYPLDTHSFTEGTNIGLIWREDVAKQFTSTGDSVATFYLLRNQQLLIRDVNVLLIINTYSKNDPVPGGCNLSFETELAPYQKVNQSNDIITVMSQPPSLFGVFCNSSNIVTEMYYLYLNEYDNDSDEYFLGIQKMASFENVTKYGSKVPGGLGYTKFKQMYSKYTGTGRIFAVVSTYKGGSSVYVPATSFGCNLNEWEEDCVGPEGAHWKLVTALLLICGLLICLGGHRFFRIGLFINGYTFGVIIMLLVVTIDDDFSTQGKVIYSLIVGIIVAITWVFLWWKFGVPVVAVQLTFLLAGLVVASILFYTQLGSIYVFANDLTFWTCFAVILLISQIPLLYLTPLSHIIALSLLGSYAVTVAMNYYVGGNLPYILINTYRRMTVKGFGMALIDPPYQLLDVWQTVLWILIFGIGIYIQRKHSLGKPPFPPHRRGLEIRLLNERTPLLQDEMPPPYSIHTVG